jgi:GTP-binding protein
MLELTERFLRQLSSQARDRTMALFLVDASQGVLPADHQLANLLRQLSLPTVLVLNKCDLKAADPGTVASFEELGFPESVPVSAQQGEGFADLYQAMQPFIDRVNATPSDDAVDGLISVDEWEARPSKTVAETGLRLRSAQIGHDADPLRAENAQTGSQTQPTTSLEHTDARPNKGMNSSSTQFIEDEFPPSSNRHGKLATSVQASVSVATGAAPETPDNADSLTKRRGASRGTTESSDALNPDVSIKNKSDESSEILRLAIIGRPNVGKSTLINALLGYERLLAAPYPGVTRDNVTVSCSRFGGVLLTDTAGVRRPTISSRPASDATVDALETGTYRKMLESIGMANVCCLLLDAAEIAQSIRQSADPRFVLTNMEHRLIQEVTELRGRPLLIGLNKADLLSDRAERASVEKAVRLRLQNSAPEARHAPIFSLCATTLSSGDAAPLIQAARELLETWSKRWTRTELSYWLRNVTKRHPPPALAKFAYLVQSGTRPPEFSFFGVPAAYLPPTYQRTLLKALKAEFSLERVPVRLRFCSRARSSSTK